MGDNKNKISVKVCNPKRKEMGLIFFSKTILAPTNINIIPEI